MGNVRVGGREESIEKKMKKKRKKKQHGKIVNPNAVIAMKYSAVLKAAEYDETRIHATFRAFCSADLGYEASVIYPLLRIVHSTGIVERRGPLFEQVASRTVTGTLLPSRLYSATRPIHLTHLRRHASRREVYRGAITPCQTGNCSCHAEYPLIENL